MSVAAALIWRGWTDVNARQPKAERVQTTQVVGAQVHRGDIPVYVNGLGTVVPVYTVTVNSRVQGQLMQVLYREGQTVQQGDPLVEIDPRPFQVALQNAEGVLERDQALLENAKLDLTRYETLIQQNAIPQQQLATQRALVKQYEGSVVSDQSQVDNAQLNLSFTHITSPITGRIGLRLVDPGNLVNVGSTVIAVVTQIQPISVVFTIGEDQLPSVRDRLRDTTTLQVTAFDRGMQKALAQGTLQTIDNQIDPTTGTVRLRAQFDNKNEELFPEQFVNAQILLQEKKGVTLLPNAGVQRNGANTYAWRVDTDGTVHAQNVIVGTAGADESEIVQGLKPGDRVVTDGVDRLREGEKVNFKIPDDRTTKRGK